MILGNLRHASAVVFATFLLIACACSRKQEHIEYFGWTKELPEFDSVLYDIEADWLESPDEHWENLTGNVGKLSEIASKHPENPRLDLRAEYWAGRLCNFKSDTVCAKIHFAKVLQLLDKWGTPYDKVRYEWSVEPDYVPLTARRAADLVRQAEIMDKSGDLPYSAGRYMEVGSLLTDIGDPERALRYLERVDSMLKGTVFEPIRHGNMLNIAKATALAQDSTKGADMLRGLLKDSLVSNDPYLLNICLYNIYVFSGDTVALGEAYRMVEDDPDQKELVALYASSLTEEAVKEGDIAMGEKYSRIASSNIDLIDDMDYLRDYHYAMAELYKLKGDFRNESRHRKMLMDVSSQVRKASETSAIVAAEFNRIMEKEREDKARTGRKAMWWWIVIGIIATGAAGCAIGFFVRKASRSIKSERSTARELERSQRMAMAMQLAREENERTRQKMTDALSASHTGNGEGGEQILQSKIEAILKQEKLNNELQSEFITLFSSQHPGFITSLKERYPKVTDSDAKLASYIKLGLDNKHIARISGIRPESVKQARWRLRQHMELPAGTDLDRTIQSLS